MANQTFMQFNRNDDVIDSRDIIKAIEAWREYIEDELDDDIDKLDKDETEEYEYLLVLEAEFSGYCPDWQYGVSLIADDYFDKYAQQLAEDLGAVSDEWPGRHIDWEAAADELKQDYTEGYSSGYTYWAR